MKATFESEHGMTEEVYFLATIPGPLPANVIRSADYVPEVGEIVGIRFTEGAVFYDVYSPYWGKVFDKIPSDMIKDAPVNLLPEL